MSSKVVTALKYYGLVLLFLMSVISCQEDIENIGVSMVDNNTFENGNFTSEVISVTEDIASVPANSIGQYLLGSYEDPEFGLLNASVVTQLALPTTGDSYNYGTNAKIDTVIMSIPYQFTQEDDYEGGKPKFSIDSVFGNPDNEFQLNIYELKTFLNQLDPDDPTKRAIYYSDKEFQRGSELFYSGGFKVNPDDTVTYVNRYLADGITWYDRDTIKEEDLSPTMKIPLDKELVKQLFLDDQTGPQFQSFAEFSKFFRGFYIESKKMTYNSHLISLAMDGAKMTIYYSKDEDEDEEEDLNGNGVNGESGVRIKEHFTFNFGTLKSSIYERDYTQSKQSGNDRLYLQGASGSLGVIELFPNDDVNELRNNNWLITDAQLIFYVDPNADTELIPEQLFIYNYDKNLQIIDMVTSGLGTVGGELVRDDDGTPQYYKIRVTELISEMLAIESPTQVFKLGIRVYNPSDSPSAVSDTQIKHYNWNPKGVVLFDHNPSAGDKRLKLEITYTELIN